MIKKISWEKWNFNKGEMIELKVFNSTKTVIVSKKLVDEYTKELRDFRGSMEEYDIKKYALIGAIVKVDPSLSSCIGFNTVNGIPMLCCNEKV